MIRIQEIIDELFLRTKEPNTELVQKAYVFAAAAHAGQTRLSGEPYLSHPLAVAHILATLGFDEATLAAALLHDTVEDTKATIEEIDEQFGEDVADLVDGITKINLIPFDTKEEAQAENIRKMILAMSHDIRVLIIKLADRLHNMRTLNFQKMHKQKRISQETKDIYAPLANRLGLHIIKQELEDLSFKYLKPDFHSQIINWLADNKVIERKIIDKVVELIKNILSENDIKGEVIGRIKHIYSIHKKMVEQHLTLDEMHDIMAFRIIVSDVKDCYAALGLVHSQWRPVHGRFKDYISTPKNNGYQSLHTTVIGPEGERIEIQIRTEEMHRQAEHGVASHWLYKEGNRINSRDLEQFTWIRDIFERMRNETDSKEFMHSLRMDLFKDEVFVYTPMGAVKELPEGSTPIDFAYHIHTKVGDHCAGSKINGKLVPLSTILKNGDTVHIITDAAKKPNRDWLKMVKTAKARSRIQYYLRTEEKSYALSLGKEMLEKEGRKVSINIQKATKQGQLLIVANDMNFDSVSELLASIGYAHHTPRKVLNKLYAVLNPNQEPSTPPEPSPSHSKDKVTTEGVHLKGVDGILMRFAKCCTPVPGDDIIGYISRGLGISVHRSDCANVANMEPERLISVYWDNQEDKPYQTRIRIICENKKGVLARITELLAKDEVNIDALTSTPLLDGRAEMELTIEVNNASQLYDVINKIQTLPQIIEVIRSAEE